MAQSKSALDHHYQEVDSFLNHGLPESAYTYFKKNIKGKSGNDEAQMIKAAIYEMSLISAKDESDTFEIRYAESELNKSSSPVAKAIWHSIIASLYNDYFDNDRWEILQRTQVANNASEDFSSWSANQFLTKINEHFNNSIKDVALLRSIPLKQYDAILTPSSNVATILPTLYDFLAWRAHNFYTTSNLNIAAPQDQLVINKEQFFAPAHQFSKINLADISTDTTTQVFHTIRSFQNRLLPLLASDNREALLYADIERLNFVYDKAVMPDKAALYYKSLTQLLSEYNGVPSVEMATYELLNLEYQALQKNNNLELKVTKTPQDIFSALQSLVQQHPNTEAAVEAERLIISMTSKSLNVVTEKVYLPSQNIKFKADYRNVPKVHFRLYKVKHEDITVSDMTYLKKLIKDSKLVSAWSEELPGMEDFANHSVELKIDALPLGAYILLANDEEKNFMDKPLGFTSFQVSQLAVINTNGASKKEYVVADRMNGMPINGATISFQQLTEGRRMYWKEIAKVISNVNGVIDLEKSGITSDRNYYNFLVIVSKGNDSIATNTYFQNYYNEQNNDATRSVIFTDRSIYRPGQTVYFKGIKFRSTNKSTKHDVLPNVATTVMLRDANNEEQGRIALTTNEYGSYQGSFSLPTGLLNGSFTISDEHTTQSIQVEEYKRPKFFVTFDTIKDSYRLNDAIEVKGSATAYAGNAVTDAKVKYRVVRSVYYPYPWLRYWYPYPSENISKEIANGEVLTDATGKYTVPFTLKPDESIDAKNKPVFSYTIYVDVTDINGETHTQSQTITAGYDRYIITADVAENATLKGLEQVTINTKNLNGVAVAAPLKITISKLQFPGILRKRYWEMPDKQRYSLAEFRTLFPYDEYTNESEPINWQVEKLITTLTVNAANKPIDIPIKNFTQNGYYLIEIESNNPSENIKAKFVTHLYDNAFINRPEIPLAISTNKESLQPDEVLNIKANSAFHNTYIRHLWNNIFEKKSELSHTNAIVRKLSEQDRGGISYAFHLINNNRIYSENKTVNVPWTNKELNIEWATHRNKLLPGSKEEWTMTIRGDKKEQVAAEMISVLYDASLDALKPHSWDDLKNLYPSVYGSYSWEDGHTFTTDYFRAWRGFEYRDVKNSFNRQFPDIKHIGGQYNLFLSEVVVGRSYGSSMKAERLEMAAPAVATMDRLSTNKRADAEEVPTDALAIGSGQKALNQETKSDTVKQVSDIKARTNFKETAYFFPQLHTNSDGDIVVKFEMPEALTEWKMMSVAHTKDMRVGMIDGKIITQKDLMVQPNMPRYFRQNDKVVLSTKIANLTEAVMSGNATIEILDPNTLQSLHNAFKIQNATQSYEVGVKGNGELSWEIDVPTARYEPVLVRITARSGNFSDAEEHLLPVLTNRMLVTETMPLPVRGSGVFNFNFDKLINANSPTLLHKNFTIEYTPNPAWYAVQALPYLQNYPYDCAEQTFNKYYATAIAHKIVTDQPKIQEIFRKWEMVDTAALMSNLQKNEELKSALLEQTPWVLEAKNEAEQKRLIAELFNHKNIATQFNTTLRLMEQSQKSDGGWGWFSGMESSPFITQYIVTGIGKLNSINANNNQADRWNAMTDKAIAFLDQQLVKSFRDLKRYNRDWEKTDNIDAYTVNYFYMRSFFGDKKLDFATQEAYNFYYKIGKKQAIKMKLYQKAQMAIVTSRNKDVSVAKLLVQSLKETAMNNAEMGMYWKENTSSYYWYEAPIETQALIIEAFSEVTNDEQAVNDQKTWLLKQKQTQDWGTTKATADACYALIMKGDNWLADNPSVKITTGDRAYQLGAENTEEGTGYFKQRIAGLDVTPSLGKVTVAVQQPESAAQRPSWGAAYWQYFEEMDKVTSAATPLKISKRLFVKRNTDAGPQLFEVNENNKLTVGDRMTVRVTISVDRAMEYLHLKDMRAAAFEPVDVLSGYQYNGGLGYYRSISDASVNFFFDRIDKGVYVFEYDLFVNAAGTYSNGISTIQCMYAPEFSAHTEGVRLEIK